MTPGLPSVMILVALALFGAAVSQQFLGDWALDTAAWGALPNAPYTTWNIVQPTANQDKSLLSSVRFMLFSTR